MKRYAQKQNIMRAPFTFDVRSRYPSTIHTKYAM